DAGLVVVNVEVDDALVQLKLPDLQTLAMIVGQPLRPQREPGSLPLPFVSKTGIKLETARVELEPGKSASMIRAGDQAQTMAAIDAMRGSVSAVAGYTFRGPTKEAQ